MTGDGRDLPFDDSSFDAVVCHTALCHIPGPEGVLAEALRVTRPIGWLAVFDGDYATTTVAISDHDPLQALALKAAIAALVHDRWLFRRLPTLIQAAGWQVVRTRSHGYVETAEAQYMLTLVDRGADALAAAGIISDETAEFMQERGAPPSSRWDVLRSHRLRKPDRPQISRGMSRPGDGPDHPPGDG